VATLTCTSVMNRSTGLAGVTVPFTVTEPATDRARLLLTTARVPVFAFVTNRFEPLCGQ